jgi:RNA polymerase sigma-70 factor (ECF subfamily)
MSIERASMSDSKSMTALLKQARTGNRQALDVILQWLRQQVRPWAEARLRGELRHKLDASDIAQEVCLRVYRAFDRLHANCSTPLLLGWARAILQNVITDGFRRCQRELGGAPLPEVVDDTSVPESRAERAEQASRLEQAVAHLPERERRVFQLRFQQGRGNGEVARQLGISMSMVSRIFYRAIRLLRSKLAE